VETETRTTDGTEDNPIFAICPGGRRATGGGGSTSPSTGAILERSVPTDAAGNPLTADGQTPFGWLVEFNAPTNADLTVYAKCIP
jgi:hypothetical protein